MGLAHQYVVFKGVEGFADRLQCLLQVIAYAKKTGRILVIDWRDADWQHSPSILLSDYLYLEGINYLSKNADSASKLAATANIAGVQQAADTAFVSVPKQDVWDSFYSEYGRPDYGNPALHPTSFADAGETSHVSDVWNMPGMNPHTNFTSFAETHRPDVWTQVYDDVAKYGGEGKITGTHVTKFVDTHMSSEAKTRPDVWQQVYDDVAKYGGQGKLTGTLLPNSIRSGDVDTAANQYADTVVNKLTDGTAYHANEPTSFVQTHAHDNEVAEGGGSADGQPFHYKYSVPFGYPDKAAGAAHQIAFQPGTTITTMPDTASHTLDSVTGIKTAAANMGPIVAPAILCATYLGAADDVQ